MLPSFWRVLAASTSLPSYLDKILAAGHQGLTCSSKCNIHVFLYLGILAQVLSSSASARQPIWLEACPRCLILALYRIKYLYKLNKIGYILQENR